MDCHHQGIALTRYPLMLELKTPHGLLKSLILAGKKKQPFSGLSRCLQQKTWRGWSALLWSSSSFLPPAPTNPREPSNSLCLDMGTLENGYLQ